MTSCRRSLCWDYQKVNKTILIITVIFVTEICPTFFSIHLRGESNRGWRNGITMKWEGDRDMWGRAAHGVSYLCTYCPQQQIKKWHIRKKKIQSTFSVLFPLALQKERFAFFSFPIGFPSIWSVWNLGLKSDLSLTHSSGMHKQS